MAALQTFLKKWRKSNIDVTHWTALTDDTSKGNLKFYFQQESGSSKENLLFYFQQESGSSLCWLTSIALKDWWFSI